MRKRSRYFTIMVVPHTEESTYSMRLPLYLGQVLVALAVLALAGVAILVYAYYNAAQEAQEARELRQANQIQQEEINAFALETQQLLEQMSQIEVLTEVVSEKLGISIDEPEPENNDSAGNHDSSAASGEGDARLYASRGGVDSRVLDRAAANIQVLQNLLPGQTDLLENPKVEVEEYVNLLAATPSIWPVRGRISSGYGMRRSPFNRSVMEFHRGIDIVAAHGTPIYATADGRVTWVGYRGAAGHLVIINHGYGYETYYAHLSRYAVSSGQWVKRGQVVGYMGATGRVTGTHLHYEVHVNGVAVNPRNYLN